MYKQNFIDRNPFFYKVYHESFLSNFLHKVKQIGVYFYYKSRAAEEYIASIPRALGWKDKRFLPLKGYHNKYRGKRCFITCTGPSLTIEDLEKLGDEYVFGMNSICLIHDKTDWKPDFYGIQDILVYNKLKDKLLSTDNGVVFAPYWYQKHRNTPSDWIYWHMCGSYHLYEMIYGTRWYTKFSDDSYVRVFDGYSITYSLLQIAMYMGFGEIYLIGADCNYLGQHQHFIEHGVFEEQKNWAAAGDRQLVSFSVAKQYADAHGIKIFNATRGGCLELFPRVVLEDVLKKKERNKIYE